MAEGNHTINSRTFLLWRNWKIMKYLRQWTPRKNIICWRKHLRAVTRAKTLSFEIIRLLEMVVTLFRCDFFNNLFWVYCFYRTLKRRRSESVSLGWRFIAYLFRRLSRLEAPLGLLMIDFIMQSPSQSRNGSMSRRFFATTNRLQLDLSYKEIKTVGLIIPKKSEVLKTS